MPLISLIDAGYKYPGSDQWVFHHFSMAIGQGEVVRITGRNGSGKTTILKVLSGLLQLREGTLQKQSGVKVAYMDQFSGEMLARDLTVYEQLMAATPRNIPSEVAPLTSLSKFGLGLQDRLGEFVGHLSGGQRQIIALLCVLAAGANVLCLDEFTSSMDTYSTQVANELLAHAITTVNIALALVSHTESDIKTDRVLDIQVNLNTSVNT
jgi:ATPase subunit of ABC transporter with duplicated ATPase domains